MAEIKTMEHYIVARLQELETDVATKDTVIDNLNAELDCLRYDYKELLAAVREIAEIRTTNSVIGNENEPKLHYIAFESLYETWDKDKFDYFVEKLGPNVKKEDDDE